MLNRNPNIFTPFEYSDYEQADRRRALEIGSPVALVEYRGWTGNKVRQYTRLTVAKLTKTQITASNGRRYMKSTGYEVGHPRDAWHDADMLLVLDAKMEASIAADVHSMKEQARRRKAEQENKRMRREIREHPFLKYADGDDVRMVLAVMNRWKAASDEKSAREHAKWETEQAEREAHWNRRHS